MHTKETPTTDPQAKILVVDSSVVETTTLQILLSPLSRNITTCLDYRRGVDALKYAADRDEPYDLVFLALPLEESPAYDLAVRILADAMSSTGPARTIILGGHHLPAEFAEYSEDGGQCLTKPITRAKLEAVLTPLGFFLPKLNCWEYLHCGREPGGARCEELGVCPTALEEAGEGLHGGSKGGRACWAISGTLCGGVVQGTFCSKIENCMECDFYRLVQAEEGECFESIDSVLNRLRRKKEMLTEKK